MNFLYGLSLFVILNFVTAAAQAFSSQVCLQKKSI